MADAAMWAKRVAAWRASGKTTAAFCEGRDFAASTLRWWSSRLGVAARSKPSQPMLRMARVLRAPSRPTGARASGSASTRAAIVVEVAGACVSVSPGFDRTTLAAVLDVVGARARVGTR